jgi:hypothetical protein
MKFMFSWILLLRPTIIRHESVFWNPADCNISRIIGELALGIVALSDQSLAFAATSAHSTAFRYAEATSKIKRLILSPRLKKGTFPANWP